jgi:hypothetical protein
MFYTAPTKSEVILKVMGLEPAIKKPLDFRSLIGEEIYSWFVGRCEKRDYLPDQIVWNKRKGVNLTFTLVLEGCIAIWDNMYRENTIDALVVPGQIIGDFEYFGYKSDSFELRTLSNCTVMSATTSTVDELKAIVGQQRFYEIMCELFIGKLFFQNKLVKLRFRSVKRRLAKFIDAFLNDDSWRQLTTLGSEQNKNEFDISLLFDKETLRAILTCDDRGIEPNFGAWVKDEIVKIKLFNRKFEFSNFAIVDSIGCLEIPKEFPYFQISVVNYNALCAAVDLY